MAGLGQRMDDVRVAKNDIGVAGPIVTVFELTYEENKMAWSSKFF